jgi:hypothetical protein
MKFHPRVVATALLVTALFCVSTVPAGAGTIEGFSVNFTGEKQEGSSTVPIAGSGSFSVDVGGSACVETVFMGCVPGNPTYPSLIVYNPLTSFSIDIAEQHYGNLASSEAWWSAGSQQPGYAAYNSRYDPGIATVVYNQWFAGDPLYGTRQFIMYFTATDGTSGYGTWNEYIQGYSAQGTWSATANSAVVPVPAAVWLFGSGLLGLIAVARRKAA